MEQKLLHYVFMNHYLHVFEALAFVRLRQNLIFSTTKQNMVMNISRDMLMTS